MQNVLEVKNLTVNLGNIDVLKDVSFDIEKGDFVGIAGPNGAGKTTLIKSILNLIPKKNGSIKILGFNYDEFNSWEKVGYLAQKASSLNNLFPATVKEIIATGLRKPKKSSEEKIVKVLKMLDIVKLTNKRISQISPGQQQKVFLARALVSGPELLIFDEPTTALDPSSRDLFFEVIGKLNKEQQVTILFITHDTGFVGKYATKLLFLDGKVVFYGDLAHLCRSKDMTKYFGESEQHLICHQHD